MIEVPGTIIAPSNDPQLSDRKRATGSRELRERLVNHIAAERTKLAAKGKELSDAAIAKQIGYSATMLSRYLSENFKGDLAKFEAAVIEYLALSAIRADVRQEVEPFETQATLQVARYLDIIRAKPQIGMIIGDAGYGKSCGIHLYREQHPKTLLWIASPLYGVGPAAFMNALFGQIEGKGWNSKRGSRPEWVINALKESKRLIIIDDAHELHEAGRRGVKSFYDLTGCPVALVGNPKMRGDWTSDDQNGSRVGYVGEVKMLPKTKTGKSVLEEDEKLRPAVRKFLDAVWPDAAGAASIFRLALEVAKHEGHLRALFHECSLAQHLIEMDRSHGRDMHRMAQKRGISIHEQAFRAAHEQLIRSYELPTL